MLISKKQTIEDKIVEILARNPYIQGPVLLAQVKKVRPATTKQAMYTALSYLLLNEIVAKAGDKYFVSQLWLTRLNELFDLRKPVAEQRDAIFDLRDGQSITYNFPSLLSCDTYWAHIYSILTDWLPKNQGVFMWEPHHWFILGREMVEKEILEDYKRKKVHAFFALQGNEMLDQKFKRDYRSDFVAINTGEKSDFPPNYFLHIFDSFLIEVFVDHGLMQAINHFYQTKQEITEEDKKFFESLVNEKSKIRMKISCNTKKASVLRKKLSKNFFVPAEISLV